MAGDESEDEDSKDKDAEGDGDDAGEGQGDGEIDFSEFKDLWDLFNYEIKLRERLMNIRNSSATIFVDANQFARILSNFHTSKERVEVYIIF